MPQDNTRKAIIYALVGNVAFATLQILFKQATAVLSSFQALYIRSVCLLLLTLAILRRRGSSPYVADHQIFRMVVVRIGLVGGGQTLVYYCLAYLPVSTVTTLFNLGPIFIFFIEAVAYKKPLNFYSLLLTAVSFIGVILILQPEFLFGSHEQKVLHYSLYVFLMVISALACAFNFHFIHGLAKNIQPMVNMIYSHMGFILMSSILCNLEPRRLDPALLTAQLILILVGVVMTGFIAQYTIFMANTLIKPSKIMPLGYLGVIIGFLADLYLFGSQFTWMHVLGMVLTSAGLLGELIKETASRQQIQGLREQRIQMQQDNKGEQFRDSRI